MTTGWSVRVYITGRVNFYYVFSIQKPIPNSSLKKTLICFIFKNKTCSNRFVIYGFSLSRVVFFYCQKKEEFA